MQQEFFPSSQSAKGDELSDAEISTQRPASWSSRSRTGDVTKNEHPSAFEEPLPPYSYHAQDQRAREEPARTTTASTSRTRPGTQQQRSQRLSLDGDALENGYRPYQTPFWARPQRQNRGQVLRIIILVMLIMLLVKMLPLLATLIITLLGIGLFLVLLPILIVLISVLVFGSIVLFILSRLGFPVWRNLFQTRRWKGNRRRW